MTKPTIEQWEQTQAELAIRRWLVAQNLWAPEAERATPPEPATPVHRIESPIGTLGFAEIEAVLRDVWVGRIGCHANGKTYVVPVTYVYDNHCIYGHTGVGMKIRMIRHNPQVCFEVDHVVDMTRWRSVIGWGRFEELEGAEAEAAMQLLINRLRGVMPIPPHGAQPATSTEPPLEAVTFRIYLAECTGRFQKPAAYQR